MHTYKRLLTTVALLLLLSACSTPGGSSNSGGATPTHTARPTPTATSARTPISTTSDTCPSILSFDPNCQTPHSMRVTYGVESLIEQSFTGKGQTVIDIVSFGSPTLQADMDTFDKQFGLPPITIQVIAPLGVARSTNQDMAGWAGETELDVQI